VVDKYSEKDEKRAKKKKQLFTSIPTRIKKAAHVVSGHWIAFQPQGPPGQKQFAASMHSYPIIIKLAGSQIDMARLCLQPLKDVHGDIAHKRQLKE
jgi:hypothetical protein